MENIQTLECAACPLSPGDQMCVTVALRALRQVSRLGYDTSSDRQSPALIVEKLQRSDSRVLEISQGECQQRQNEYTSTKRGYSPVSY